MCELDLKKEFRIMESESKVRAVFEKLNEVKVFRDPVHGYVHVHLKVIWDCINTREVQRLKRITQLGGSYQVYHTAQHTRFAHSLGVYEIARRMVEEVGDLRDSLTEQEKVTVMVAGLLHDLGHGPFSHAFESIAGFDHEQMTRRIILEDSEVHRVLVSCHPDLPQWVASVIDHTHPNKILVQMISGQLDADRMDYLLRDAYFSGTKYGEFDLERILRTVRVRDHRMVVKESGIHSVEDYIMARYHMYWQVYLHPVSRCFEIMLNRTFLRLKRAAEQDPLFLKEVPVFETVLTHHPLSVEDHFLMDEAACNYGFTCLRNCSDPILRDLSRRLLDRDLFQSCHLVNENQYKEMKEKLAAQGWDPEYYLCVDDVRQSPYQPYQGNENSMIWILMEDQTIRELSQASVIVDALVHGESKNEMRMFYPREMEKVR